MKRTNDEYIEIIREKLTDKRFYHSLCVAKEARRLAEIYGADADKAETAGLLHDICKNMTDEEQLKIFKRFGIMLTDVEKAENKLWHAMAGAAYIQGVLELDDPDIIGAVRYHTTARADMALLEKVVYLADFTSADRDYDDVDDIRAIADKGLANAMLYTLQYTISDLSARGRCIHPDTVFAYNQAVLSAREKDPA